MAPITTTVICVSLHCVLVIKSQELLCIRYVGKI